MLSIQCCLGTHNYFLKKYESFLYSLGIGDEHSSSTPSLLLIRLSFICELKNYKNYESKETDNYEKVRELLITLKNSMTS